MHKTKSLHLIVLPVLAGALAQAPAQAQEMSSGELALEEEAEAGGFSSDKIRAGFFLGGNYLSSENELGNSFHADQVPESGFLLGLRGSYLLLDSIAPHSALKPQLSAELESKLTFSSTAGGSGRDSISTPVWGWRANAVLDLNPSGETTHIGENHDL